VCFIGAVDDVVVQTIGGGGVWCLVVRPDDNGALVSGDDGEKPCEAETIEDRIIINLPVDRAEVP